MDRLLELRIWKRAGFCCEYCRMPAELISAPFQIDHIIAQKHGGQTVLGNLALACFRCNSHKGPNIAGIDPNRGRVARLFHPRRDRWSNHFVWNGAILVGRTAIGRATIDVLWINDPIVVELREILIRGDLFPPKI
jgi:hypothetical protein